MRKIFRTSRMNRAVSYILLALMVLLTAVTVHFSGTEEGSIGAAAAVIVLAFGIARLNKPAKIWGVLYGLFVTLAVPFISVLLLQYYTIDPLGEKGIYSAMLAVNCLFAYLFYFLLSVVFGSWNIGYIISTVLMMLIGIANYFVLAFRGSPIVPWDLYSIKTAASVAGNYTYEIDWRFLTATFGFILLLVFSEKVMFQLHHPIIRALLAGLMAAGLIVSGVLLQKTEIKDYLGMDQTLFTPTVRYRNNGFLAAFIGNLHLINVEKPEGYSVETVEQLQTRIQEANADSTYTTAAEFDLTEAPNIIVIMDEAFSDLSVLGDFNTDEDYMPNFRKLMEEYTGGYLMTSVKGGNTANTEYEFLSGDTMAFLPAGSVVFQQFIHDNIPALPTQLANLGYTTVGIHPYLPGGWNRNTVYPQLGFQSFLSQYDFSGATKLRDYIDDQSAFEKVISEFEDREEGEKKFIFEVTMQNHSGYSKEYPGFTEEVHLTDLSYSNTQTAAAEKYLTLIKKSDEALGNLMDYFSSVEEPTIIVMFGDHEPTDYITNVIAHITGYDGEESLEEQQKSYLVPYFVWSNFDMEMQERPLTSVNYLAADILEAAGLPLTDYQQFLLELQEAYPVICGSVYIDEQGVYHAHGDEEPEQITEYRTLQYNHLIDTSNRVFSLFSLLPQLQKNQLSG